MTTDTERARLLYKAGVEKGLIMLDEDFINIPKPGCLIFRCYSNSLGYVCFEADPYKMALFVLLARENAESASYGLHLSFLDLKAKNNELANPFDYLGCRFVDWDYSLETASPITSLKGWILFNLEDNKTPDSSQLEIKRLFLNLLEEIK